ncbi:CoA ester lyase [Saccharomonospora sp. NPDC046836]|uniref:HpcH/HpaI aldolase/citrate lyase family protein n=1 Tax=Saccharomonospora sp. NPDC046836 TaxID=3156921 RepID=UPI0033FF58C8
MITPRSLLFVPANRPQYLPKAASSGADAVILDLEDSVPDEEKTRARHKLAANVAALRELEPDLQVHVRVNAWGDPGAADDLAAVVEANADVVYLPKSIGPEQALRAAHHLELLDDLHRKSTPTLIEVALEQAGSLASCREIGEVHDRVIAVIAAAAKNADVARSVGFRWTDSGLETLYFRSRAVLAARAAGVAPIGGLWQSVPDLDGFRAFAEANRDIGYHGMIVIHPSHVPIANDVFALQESEVAWFEGLVQAYDAAAAEGRGAARFDGEMVDLAHAVTAREQLAAHYARMGRKGT